MLGNQQQLLNEIQGDGKLEGVPEEGATAKSGKGVVMEHGQMITTSIDEGVEADMSDRDSEAKDSSESSAEFKAPAPPRLVHSNAFGDLSQLPIGGINISETSISTGISSPFTSFDSNIEADLMSSLTSCAPIPGMAYTPQQPASAAAPVITMTPPTTSKFQHHSGRGEVVEGETVNLDRSQSRSPVNFREGRRASDGLVTHGIIAFRQRLREGGKTRGVGELRREMETLASQYGSQLTAEERQKLQEEHEQYQEALSQQDMCGALEAAHESRQTLTPPTPHYDLPPRQLLAMKQSLQIERQLGEGMGSDAGQYPLTTGVEYMGEDESGRGITNPPLYQQFQQMSIEQEETGESGEGEGGAPTQLPPAPPLADPPQTLPTQPYAVLPSPQHKTVTLSQQPLIARLSVGQSVLPMPPQRRTGHVTGPIPKTKLHQSPHTTAAHPQSPKRAARQIAPTITFLEPAPGAPIPSRVGPIHAVGHSTYKAMPYTPKLHPHKAPIPAHHHSQSETLRMMPSGDDSSHYPLPPAEFSTYRPLPSLNLGLANQPELTASQPMGLPSHDTLGHGDAQTLHLSGQLAPLQKTVPLVPLQDTSHIATQQKTIPTVSVSTGPALTSQETSLLDEFLAECGVSDHPTKVMLQQATFKPDQPVHPAPSYQDESNTWESLPCPSISCDQAQLATMLEDILAGDDALNMDLT